MKNILGLISRVTILMWSATAASAATVQLTWEPNSEPDVAGYIVFYGTSSRQYIASIDVGNQTSLQFVEPDPTMRYFLAVRAYNMSGLQSDFSDEVSTQEPMTSDLAGITSNVPAPQPPTSESTNVGSPQVARMRLDADKTVPQPAGSQIVFTATARGSQFYKYKWWVFNGVECELSGARARATWRGSVARHRRHRHGVSDQAHHSDQF
jgi:hypothetical protein